MANSSPLSLIPFFSFFGGLNGVPVLDRVMTMITARQLRQMMRFSPFRPFRIHLSDGSHYDVTNHDAAIVEHNTVDIGINLDQDGIAERLVRCSILHIVKLEDIEAGVAR